MRVFVIADCLVDVPTTMLDKDALRRAGTRRIGRRGEISDTMKNRARVTMILAFQFVGS